MVFEVFSDDETRIESLRDASNFFRWKFMVTLQLKHLKLWDITSGATPRPTTESPDSTPANSTSTPSATALAVSQKAWDQASNNAKLFLITHVESDIQSYILTYDTAPKMWKALMNRFNRHDTLTLHRCLKAILDLRYTDNSAHSLADHLEAFQRNWGQLAMRTADVEPGEGSLGGSLKVMAASSEVKAAFLINSLPRSMDNVIDNLRIRHGEELKYRDVYHRLLDLHDTRESQRKSDEAAKAKEMDCTWCRSRGFESGGHTWKRCYRLSEFNKKKARIAEHDRETVI